MAKATPDDLEAVRAIIASLEPFEANDQERILRWVREKLGLVATSTVQASDRPSSPTDRGEEFQRAASNISERQADIRTFIDMKKPQSDIQFAAAVAYYYRFEAPEQQRKTVIKAADLQEACRQTGRMRFKNPATTLNNALKLGYLDKGGERGTFVVNTVGENLVAMALPEGAGPGRLSKIPGNASRRKKRL
jgi:hypothetical protein